MRAGELRSVVKAVMVAAADDVAAAWNKQHDGGVGDGRPRRVDVELEAVLAADEDAVDDVELGAAVENMRGLRY